MHTIDPSSPRPALVALALSAALALACGDEGGGSTGTGTSTGTTGTTDPATTDTPTTGGSTGGSSSGGGSTGDPAVCDGSMQSDAFACMACTECGMWDTPVTGTSYPEAMVCVLEGLRDGRVVGARSQSCAQGKCLVDRMLSTHDGTMIAQQMILDENTQAMEYLGIQELPIKDTAYFEGCLAAYDVNCASPNSWFSGASVDLTAVTCP